MKLKSILYSFIGTNKEFIRYLKAIREADARLEKYMEINNSRRYK